MKIDMGVVLMDNNLLKYNKRRSQNKKARVPQLEISRFFVAENYFVSDTLTIL